MLAGAAETLRSEKRATAGKGGAREALYFLTVLLLSLSLSLGSAATTGGRTFKGAATLLLQEAVGEDFPGKSEGGVRSPSLFNRPRRSPTSNI